VDRLIAVFEKNSREQVRVILGEYQGRDVVNIRVYWTKDHQQWFPSQKGITLGVDKLPKLAWALAAAVAASEQSESTEFLTAEEQDALCTAFRIAPEELKAELE
jgi:hypothetical protein